ncbi:hypothetical protein [Nocardiopsis xinjiangensis]|uniref:hypothetical protein n=1 Tax=Nocardiopsis xinjiangensis TaxID=124285 RepID=UPI000344C0C6|nr:hypothetical protein [Nocardiopsis xinjiangensis]
MVALALHICSLIRDLDQSVPADGDYHVVRFPFGAAESSDVHGMHQVRQPDGHIIEGWDEEERSGLIWPSVAGWASLIAMVQWEAGDYSELRDRFVRDPLELAGGADSTATDHRVPGPGMQCFTKHHEIFVDPDTPLALMVAHNDDAGGRLVHAQFKLAIDDDIA